MVTHFPLLQTSSSFPQSLFIVHSLLKVSSSTTSSCSETTSHAIPVSTHSPSIHFSVIFDSPSSQCCIFSSPSIHSASLHSVNSVILHFPSMHEACPHNGSVQSASLSHD